MLNMPKSATDDVINLGCGNDACSACLSLARKLDADIRIHVPQILLGSKVRDLAPVFEYAGYRVSCCNFILAMFFLCLSFISPEFCTFEFRQVLIRKSWPAAEAKPRANEVS